MKKESTELTNEQKAELAALEELPDDRIDTTDAPEILDWSDARRGVFYRPVKKQITLRLDADVVSWFRAHAQERTWIPDGHQSRAARARAARARAGERGVQGRRLAGDPPNQPADAVPPNRFPIQS